MTTQGDARRDTLLVGTVDGIFAFARSGAAWKQNGHFLSGEHVSALLFEPESRTLFAGTFGAALHASGDLGKSWERRDRGLREMEIYTLASQKINALTASSDNPSVRIVSGKVKSSRTGRMMALSTPRISANRAAPARLSTRR